MPTLKELLGSLWSVPENIASVMEEFKPMFPNFDWSLFNKYEDPLHFYLEDISDDFAKRILLEKESSHEDSLGSNSVDLIIDHIKEIYPTKAESNKSVLLRINKAKKFIYSLLHDRLSMFESKMASKQSKVVVVTHSAVIKIWTGEWERPLSEYENLPKPTKCKSLKNWEFCLDETDYSAGNLLFHS